MKWKIATLGLLALSIAACTPEQEAKWSATVNSIKQGIQVTTEAARQTLNEVCAQQVTIIPAAQAAISIAQSRGNGPRTQQSVQAINAGITGFAAACGSGNATTSSLASLTVKAWTAYQAIQNAQAVAQAANGA